MSCSRPFLIRNNSTSLLASRYIQVPCGWCLNCRIDKRNFIEDCSIFNLRKFKSCATFLTVTYSDFNLNRFNLFRFFDKQGKPIYTCCYEHVQKFLKRLRIYLDRNNLYNGTSICRDFRFICTSEYGGKFQRPHYHFIFYGLDYKVMEKIFFKCWGLGICDSLPVQRGCVRYVLKYIEKEVKGPKAKEIFDSNGLERPRHRISSRFYYELLKNNYDNILSTGEYKLDNNHSRPVNQYLRSRYRLGKYSAYDKYMKLSNSLYSHGYTSCYKSNGSFTSGNFYNTGFSIRVMNLLKHELAIQREKDLVNASHRFLEPITDTFYDLKSIEYVSKQFNSFELIEKINYL